MGSLGRGAGEPQQIALMAPSGGLPVAISNQPGGSWDPDW